MTILLQAQGAGYRFGKPDPAGGGAGPQPGLLKAQHHPVASMDNPVLAP